MKRMSRFGKAEFGNPVSQQEHDWLPDLVAVFLAVLIVAAFFLVGDYWIGSELGR